MRKIFSLLSVAVVITANAQVFNITTSCGIIVRKEFSDNMTLKEIKEAVSQVNYQECGKYADKVSVII